MSPWFVASLFADSFVGCREAGAVRNFEVSAVGSGHWRHGAVGLLRPLGLRQDRGLRGAPGPPNGCMAMGHESQPMPPFWGG